MPNFTNLATSNRAWSRRAGLSFALAAFVLAVGFADASSAAISLKSPTGDSTARPSGSTVKVTGTSTKSGLVVIESSVAPYESGWSTVEELEVSADEKFSFSAKEQLNARYRATLVGAPGSADEVSKVVGVWRKWPKWTATYRNGTSSYTAYLSSTLPRAILDGYDLKQDLQSKIIAWNRFVSPGSIAQRDYSSLGSKALRVSGRTIRFSFTVRGPSFRWRSAWYFCTPAFKGQAPFGTPRTWSAKACPPAGKKITPSAKKRYDRIWKGSTTPSATVK